MLSSASEVAGLLIEKELKAFSQVLSGCSEVLRHHGPHISRASWVIHAGSEFQILSLEDRTNNMM